MGSVSDEDKERIEDTRLTCLFLINGWRYDAAGNNSLPGSKSMACTISTQVFGPPTMGIDDRQAFATSNMNGVPEGRLSGNCSYSG